MCFINFFCISIMFISKSPESRFERNPLTLRNPDSQYADWPYIYIYIYIYMYICIYIYIERERDTNISYVCNMNIYIYIYIYI